MLLEGNYNLKPPCYSNTLINPISDTCLAGSPWVDKYAQKNMGGSLGDNV